MDGGTGWERSYGNGCVFEYTKMCYNTQKCVTIHKSVLEHTKVYSNTQKCIRLSGTHMSSSFGRKLDVAVCRVKSAITQESEWSRQKSGGALYSPLFRAQSSVFQLPHELVIYFLAA